VTPQGSGSAGINHLVSYGQSLSVGVSTGGVISTAQPYDSLMFNGGVRAQDGGTSPFGDHESLIPLVEAVGPAADGGNRQETPLSGACDMLKERGSALQYLASAPGLGGVSIATLSKPGALYTRLLDDVQQGNWRARQQGTTHKVRAFFWMQGEADGANNNYAANLNTLRTDLDADIKALTGQPDDVWCISYQVPRAKIGLAHLAASDAYARIRVAMPIYQLETVADGVHLTPQSSKVAGAYFALAYKAIVEDGDTDWQPLRIVATDVAGDTLDLTYSPVGSLVFDTTTVAAQTNHGFRLFESDGTTAITINSVSIVGTDTVRIVAADTIPAGAIVRYAFSDPANVGTGAVKGNLRDSQGDTIVFDGGGLDYPMHNWAVAEQVTP
jgi:hypothetical protein